MKDEQVQAMTAEEFQGAAKMVAWMVKNLRERAEVEDMAPSGLVSTAYAYRNVAEELERDWDGHPAFLQHLDDLYGPMLPLGEMAHRGDYVCDYNSKYRAWTPILDGPVEVTARRFELGYCYRGKR